MPRRWLKETALGCHLYRCAINDRRHFTFLPASYPKSQCLSCFITLQALFLYLEGKQMLLWITSSRQPKHFPLAPLCCGSQAKLAKAQWYPVSGSFRQSTIHQHSYEACCGQGVGDIPSFGFPNKRKEKGSRFYLGSLEASWPWPLMDLLWHALLRTSYLPPPFKCSVYRELSLTLRSHWWCSVVLCHPVFTFFYF